MSIYLDNSVKASKLFSSRGYVSANGLLQACTHVGICTWWLSGCHCSIYFSIQGVCICYYKFGNSSFEHCLLDWTIISMSGSDMEMDKQYVVISTECRCIY